MRRPQTRAVVLAVALALIGGACDRPEDEPPTPTTPPTKTTPEPTTSGSTGAPQGPFDPERIALELQPFAEGFDLPLYLTNAGDGSGRLYVVEQSGRIRVVEADGTVREEPYLDLSGDISLSYEQGLLGLAFHPRFPDDDRLFVNYVDTAGDTVIAEFRGDADRADPDSQRVLFHIDQPASNHNGGQVLFGPDGFLYLGLGDGGFGGDPDDHGQRTDTFLAKILRIDVDSTTGDLPYGIPPDNPFASGDPERERPEIFALGLRNPWRFSFDPETGDLWIGDVGQDVLEEVDRLPAGTGAGANLGWRVMEGSLCFVDDGCDQDGLILPVFEYQHDQGCAVIGGHVYRGSDQPALQGAYLFSDVCSGLIWAMDAEAAEPGGGGAVVVLESRLEVSSFGLDEAGELYLTDIAGGDVYLVTATLTG